MKGMIGKKIGMTQIFQDDRVVPVTVVKASPCVITQVKTVKSDGYNAVQMGMIERVKESGINKPMRGHLAKAGSPAVKRLVELRLEEEPQQKVGETLAVSIFSPQDFINVVGTSKGKGFQGVVKRYGFKGGPGGHGSMFHRAPGSIGASAYPSRVWKGMRMGGRMGGKRIKVKNLQVVKVDAENNLLYIRGGVPGARNSYLFIASSKRGASK